MSKSVWIWVRDIGIAVVIAILIVQFIKPTIVNGHSMDDTLHDRDYLFLSKQAYTIFGDPQRGDIVVCHSSLESDDGDGSTKDLVKRVIGLPGDTVSISDGKVYLNGKALDEPYTKDHYTDGEMSEITVPDGKFFLMGDNRQSSRDSRDSSVGFVPGNEILGKAFFRLFPFTNIGPVG